MNEAASAATFLSPDEALRFSYGYTQGSYPANQLGRYQKKGAASEQRLPSGLDAATLAGWVRNVVEGGNGAAGIVEPYRSILLARHCPNRQINLQAKIHIVGEALAFAMGTGLHKRRMVDLLVQRYFGGKAPGPDGVSRPIRQHQVADQCDVSQQTVSAADVKLSKWLKAKEKTAMELVARALVGRGLVVNPSEIF